MKPAGHDKRPKDWIPMANFAMVKSIPTQVRLRDHLFPFAGAAPQPDLLWGVHGTTSINASVFTAAAHATAQQCQALQITTWYRVDNFQAVTTPLTREASRQAGYLHLGRLNAAFRDDICATWQSWLKQESPSLYALQSDFALEDLALHHPHYVWRMFRDNAELLMVIHPVQPSYPSASGTPVWIATVRATAQRIMASEVRYLPDVQVVA